MVESSSKLEARSSKLEARSSWRGTGSKVQRPRPVRARSCARRRSRGHAIVGFPIFTLSRSRGVTIRSL
ncbi:hypothetical protein B9D88_029660 [Burkholderia pseudomallei]|nr:hypothetical protein B9D88_029660 [Burkholderia pseudomallei]